MLERSALDRARAAQQAHGKIENRTQKLEHPMHRDSYEAERQSKQPHDWVQDEREQDQRPTQHKQNAPKKKSSHGNLLPLLLRSSQPGSSLRGKGIQPQPPGDGNGYLGIQIHVF